MSRLLPRAAALLAALALPVTAMPARAPTPAMASPRHSAASGFAPAASGQPPRPGMSARARPAGGKTSLLTLINGDRAVASHALSAGQAVRVARAAGAAGAPLVSLDLAGRAYLIPVDAMPYLGRGLSLSLFDLVLLEHDEAGGRVPVDLAYRGRVPALPGVTITGARGGMARGYLSPAGAVRFGAALARQFRTDHARASYGVDGMFAHGLSLTLPGSRLGGRQALTRPDYPMRTLTLTGKNRSGQPDTGDEVDVVNVDNPAKAAAFSSFYHGTAKFSVPAGHYEAIAVYLSGARASLVVLPQFTVSAATTVHADARAATSRITMVTPRPARLIDNSFEVFRGTADGGFFSYGLDNFGPLWVSPTKTAPTVGTLRTALWGHLVSPAGMSGRPYEYDLVLGGSAGIISARQRYEVRPATLATVDARYYQDGTSIGGWAPLGMTGFQVFEFATVGVVYNIYPFRLPRRETQYYSAGPSVLWMNSFEQSYLSGDGGQYDGLRVLRAGSNTVQPWNAYPLHPAPSANTLGGPGPYEVGVTLPSAVRAGNTLTLDLTPFSDNTAGQHIGSGFWRFSRQVKLAGHYALYQDGRKIASGNAAKLAGAERSVDLFFQARVSGRPATFRFVLSAARTGPLFRLSTASRTVWTWRSARPRAGNRLPAGYSCADGSRKCAAQPLLTLDYAVAGMTIHGSTRPGRQVVTIQAAHMPPAGSAKIAHASVAVSFNGGRNWHPAQVTRISGERFRAVFTAPAGAYVTLRTSAVGPSGQRITETISRAYQITQPGAGTAAATMPGERALSQLRPAAGKGRMRAACMAPPPGQARCYVLFAAQAAVNQAVAAGGPARPMGLSPQDIERAYRLPVSRGKGQTVAVVEAYDTARLAKWLSIYRRHYHLPPCTQASGCLRIVNQRGKPSPLPSSGLAVSSGWDVEASLDVSMVSAACPHCHILVVEANTPTFQDLATAENTAARLGASAISNSYGAEESGFEQPYAKAYDHPGHAIVVSSGDEGFGPASFPANLATVTAAGGTVLRKAHNTRGFTEQVWNNEFGAGGSGCSAYIPKPSWQHDPHCLMRTVADVAAVAWNIPVYDSHYGGWISVAGTSASSPLIAGIYALAGNAATIQPGDEYRHARDFFDITNGANAPRVACGGDYLCVAKKGYDAPTGLGTPDGTGAF